ncbi:hypothetical protein [Idiomarina xiamenensis]|uniref:Prephenate dehydrogenase n=1 Tax=Idiomarina xiamenensis 10-D-4 TaxID=740709 RepID=K2KCY6_9GAMM|nr:hypothetical protein [Idiomarina xiamenensis]EKE84557.1 hypothetical protein A10D4_05797 [Idiomarina xiamenensis 10-D-4]
MQALEEKLQQHLQNLYRQVLDADQYIDDMRRQGQAKFADIFTEDSVFNVRSNKFQPYLTETTDYFQQWQNDKNNEELLQALVQRLQLLTETLARLKAIRQQG